MCIMISDTSLPSKSVGDRSPCICYLVHTRTTKCVSGIASLSPSDKLKNGMDNGKGELANKDESAAKKQKVVTLECKQSYRRNS